MKILALDTSTEHCSIALSLHGHVISKEILAGQQHSELLLPLLSDLLQANELTLFQLDGIAFGAGPGSFTGLRIACGVAQGLAFATSIPIIGVSTLEALAQKTGCNKVIATLDARMGEIYHAAYIKTADYWETVSEPTVCLPLQAPALTGDNWVGCGSGFDVYHKELSQLYTENLLDVQHGLYPHAREISQIAIAKFTQDRNLHATNALPIYIRNKVALKENER